MQREVFDVYELQKSIGAGTSSAIYQAIERETGQVVAVKIIKLWGKSPELPEVTQTAQVTKNFCHPNILKTVETYESDAFVAVVTDYFEGGTLWDRIRQCRITDETQVAVLMKKVFSAVAYCHRRRVCHRNLSPEHIIFASKHSNNSVKLIGFGRSAILPIDGTLSGAIGNIHFMAPEMLLSEYTEAVDCWSLGVILYVMFTGTYPFSSSTARDTQEKILHYDLKFEHPAFRYISEPAKDLVFRLLIQDPKVRITVEQACVHPWFVQYD